MSHKNTTIIVLLFACAFALSGAAGFYSIVGLIAIFAAAPIPIAIMGSTLEVSKLVVASWLYKNWHTAPLLMKSYLTVALVVLMFLTSMGIFGFLSKAHVDQAVPTGNVAASIQIIDQKIQVERDNIASAKSALDQLDRQVNETLSRTSNASNDAAVRRSVALRKAQEKERRSLAASIEQSQQSILKLNQEKAPLSTELRKVEAEVGPIKYIAALIYDDQPNQDLLERAVRWVTLLIVAVFDPLAVVLLIAANWSLSQRRRAEEKPPVVVNDLPPAVPPATPVTAPNDFPEIIAAPNPISNDLMDQPQPPSKVDPIFTVSVDEPQPPTTDTTFTVGTDQPTDTQQRIEPSLAEDVWLSRPKNHIKGVDRL